MNKKQILKLSGNILHVAFIIPAIVFWFMLSYAGYSISGFLTLSAFIMHGYEVADEAARQVFERWLLYFYCGTLSFIGLIMVYLTSGNEDTNITGGDNEVGK